MGKQLLTNIVTPDKQRQNYHLHSALTDNDDDKTVVEDVVEQGRHDNCWLLASLIAVGPRDRRAPCGVAGQ